MAHEKLRLHSHFVFTGNYYEFVTALYVMCVCSAEHRKLSMEKRPTIVSDSFHDLLEVGNAHLCESLKGNPPCLHSCCSEGNEYILWVLWIIKINLDNHKKALKIKCSLTPVPFSFQRCTADCLCWCYLTTSSPLIFCELCFCPTIVTTQPLCLKMSGEEKNQTATSDTANTPFLLQIPH